MEHLCPFLHVEEVVKLVPDYYFGIEENCKYDFSWFVTAPKYSTFRINSSRLSVNEVISVISEQLQLEFSAQRSDIPSINVHEILPDCIIIGCLEKDVDDLTNRCAGDVIVDIPCGNAVLRGADVFAPGILGLRSNVKEGDLVRIFADLEKKCLRGFNRKYEGKIHLVGIGVLKMSRNDLFQHNKNPKGVGVKVLRNMSNIPRINLPREFGILQNLPSIVCGHQFSVVSGYVLDMCAAPGNKTSHIATVLGTKGNVIALDKTPGKVERIISLCSEMGLSNVSCFDFDSTKCVQKLELEDLHLTPVKPPFAPKSFSAILLDPPCSALGQRPSLYNDISPSQLKSYVALQRRLFRTAVEALKPGGMLVYSTCTITLDENEEMVSWALREYPVLSLQKLNPALGRPGVHSSLSKESQQLVTRFGCSRPSTPDEDTIGFFIAKFVKTA